MSVDTVLLLIIAVCASITTVGIIACVTVLIRTALNLEKTRLRADRILSEVEREAGPVIKDLKGTARAMTDLSSVLKRLGQEAVLKVVGGGARPDASGQSRGIRRSYPASSRSPFQLALDLGLSLSELWRRIRRARE